MSLDIPRSNNFSPAMSPDQSRRGSAFNPQMAPPLAKENKAKEGEQKASSTKNSNAQLRQNQARIAGNTEYVYGLGRTARYGDGQQLTHGTGH